MKMKQLRQIVTQRIKGLHLTIDSTIFILKNNDFICKMQKALIETVHLALPLSDSRIVKARTKQAKSNITLELNS